MHKQFHASMTKVLGFAGAAGLSVALAAPAAIAQIPEIPPTGDEFDPLTVNNLFYNLEFWDLERDGFICNNNPNPTCGNPEREVTNHSIPERRYEVNEETWGFVCNNNPDPECENPVHYGIYYDEAAEELPPLATRTEPLWAQLEESLNSRPTLPSVTPQDTTMPPPPPADPVPGLW